MLGRVEDFIGSAKPPCVSLGDHSEYTLALGDVQQELSDATSVKQKASVILHECILAHCLKAMVSNADSKIDVAEKTRRRNLMTTQMAQVREAKIESLVQKVFVAHANKGLKAAQP